jgi:hypothetical protein
LHLHPLLFRIDFKHLVSNPDINILFFLKFPGSPRNQIIQVVDNTADVIRNSSCGVGCKSAPLKSDNFQFRVATTGLGSRTHAGSIPPDDNKTFFVH